MKLKKMKCGIGALCQGYRYFADIDDCHLSHATDERRNMQGNAVFGKERKHVAEIPQRLDDRDDDNVTQCAKKRSILIVGCVSDADSESKIHGG